MSLSPQKSLRWFSFLVAACNTSQNRLVLDIIIQIIVKNVKFEHVVTVFHFIKKDPTH